MKKKYLILILTILSASFIFKGNFEQKDVDLKPEEENLLIQKEESTPVSLVQNKEISSAIPLYISEPSNNSKVISPIIRIAGQTGPNAEVFINDKDLKADQKGNFATTLNLDEGENKIIIVANDESGNSQEKEITIIYEGR